MVTSTLSQLLKKISGIRFKPSFLGSSRQDVEEMLQLCQALLEMKGESESGTISAEILHAYAAADPDEKREFLQGLHTHFDVEPGAIQQAIAAWQETPDYRHRQALQQACEAPRLEVLRILNIAPDATAALIAMRADLLGFMRDDPVLKELDQDFLSLFSAWFNRGFLTLRRIDWQTPAYVLEQLIEYESVHEIRGWPDLRRRLAADRRCFAFFHPAIPDTPLIFVEVALTRGTSRSISALIDQPPPGDGEQQTPDTAVFYSINNCLKGLRGVSFGSFLIKQVVESLAASCPSIRTWITLSPVPGFMGWLREAREQGLPALSDDELALVDTLLAEQRPTLDSENEASRHLLLRLCAYYLLQVKSRGKPADAVARFHLGNGARLERLHWLADPSDNGLRQSAGMMVNYLYDPERMADNHEAYENEDALSASSEVSRLARSWSGH